MFSNLNNWNQTKRAFTLFLSLFEDFDDYFILQQITLPLWVIAYPLCKFMFFSVFIFRDIDELEVQQQQYPKVYS